ncbi:MAG: alpha/beta hydrolase [Archangium sp.]|nr:alpha/beta hydrolase [Archangium sp.]
MNLLVRAADGVALHAEVTGSGRTALLFVHGWLGSGRWWDAQRDAFAADFTVVQVDLAGHGASGGERASWSVEAWAGDLEAVASRVDADRLVLIGHSMSGANVVVACPRIARVQKVVLVDTLKNLDQPMSLEQARPMLDLYRKDFTHGVLNVLPRYLYAPQTPPEVIARLNAEFLRVPGERAATLLEPLYHCDLQQAARAVKVPVRAINSDQQPTALEANRRWFADYDFELLHGVGHYPMLERPAAFNEALRRVLAT